jgi:hypothetical protein
MVFISSERQPISAGNCPAMQLAFESLTLRS